MAELESEDIEMLKGERCFFFVIVSVYLQQLVLTRKDRNSLNMYNPVKWDNVLLKLVTRSYGLSLWFLLSFYRTG